MGRPIRKIQSESYLSLDPTEEATRDFNGLTGTFKGRVSGDKCDSWFKQGKGDAWNVVGWPGSWHHRRAILGSPRWEDFHFEKRAGAEGNRFRYFGDGSTERGVEGDPEKLTDYLQEVGKIDLVRLHQWYV